MTWKLPSRPARAIAVALLLAGCVPAATIPAGADAPVTAPSPTGVLAVTGTDFGLWVNHGSGYASLGGSLLAQPAAADVPDLGHGGQTLYIGTGVDSNLWVRSDGRGWQPLSPSPVTCLGAPSAVVSGKPSSPTLTVACEGGDRAMWVGRTTVTDNALPSVTSWASWGGLENGGPAIVPTASGLLAAVAGTDGSIWMNTNNGGWWRTGWGCLSHPLLAASGSTTTFACEGWDQALWVAQGTNGSFPSPATRQGGILLQSVSLRAYPDHAVFDGAGADGAVWEWSSQSGWSFVGGVLLSPNAVPPVWAQLLSAGLHHVTVNGIAVDVVVGDLSHTRVITDTMNSTDCSNNCPVDNVGDFAVRNHGWAAINGTYLCPPEYSSCVGKTNSFNFSVYNTGLGRWISGYSLPWGVNRSLLTFNGAQHSMYVTDDLYGKAGSPAVTAGISMSYGAVANGQNIIGMFSRWLNGEELNVISRSAIGTRGNLVYLAVAHGATDVQMAGVMVGLGCDSAEILDGGGSTALWYNGGYVDGPGRNIPNAVVLAG